MVLWSAGDLTFEALYGAGDLPPFPNVTDGLSLGYYVAMYAGVVLLLDARLRPFRRSRCFDASSPA